MMLQHLGIIWKPKYVVISVKEPEKGGWVVFIQKIEVEA